MAYTVYTIEITATINKPQTLTLVWSHRTDTMHHSHFEELIGLRLDKNIPHFTEYVSSLKFQNTAPPVTVFTHTKPLCTLSHLFFKKYFHINHQLCPGPSSGIFIFRFFSQQHSCIISSHTRATCSAHPYTPLFYYIIFLEKYKHISKLSIASHS